MSFPRYESYKESGVEWLGDVPEHWTISALKQKVKMRYGDALASEIREEGNVEVFGSNGQVGSHCVANTKVPAIVVGRKGSYGKIVWAEKGGFVIDTAYAIDSDTTGLDLRWVYYWLQPLGLDSLSQDTGVPGLAREKAYEMRIVVPPLSEQQTIAAFLDRETAKIDALIAEQQRLIELLKEKRQSVISHAVTKGLNPNAPMKDSGIEWLGDVPKHWGLKATKRLFRLVVEPAPDNNDHELLSIYTAIGVRPRKELEEKGNKATTTNGYWMVKKGDLIVNKLLAWMGAIGISNYDGVTSPAYDILRQRIPLEPRYYDFLFRCGVCFSEFRRYSRGIMDMRLRLYFDELGQLYMPYPSKVEQNEIVSFLESELDKFDPLIAEAQLAISLLQERRTTLISATVTGKIDVRGLVSTKPEVEQAA
jgi:type I restriction enzyme S subunit